jgi:hypothetical protein
MKAWAEYSQGHREVRSAGIIPLKAEDIFSEVRHYQNAEQGLQYAHMVANGSFFPRYHHHDIMKNVEDGTTYLPYFINSFNFGNLEDPVPASIFYNARTGDCWGSQTHCNTITDGQYRPRIALRNSV